ncbi:HlyD family efflux transporter periplasmic adaptor subunit [Rhodocytophaga rosea]|uniref:HlyD family efflux transporter periplasmic adaptor subunit n=1 Tax=Rhodocytophaga rosea TaxID=2704465 RepID=A0A6C0GN37_9BACT|nr:HlyD family efflux transporter periplasmic adaptor subunit [Rhodocytophaga rosea]QHT69435.1 HlyD family efflux transporter periplasmic adaptor subunit [Rhodocytophaga rosea]
MAIDTKYHQISSFQGFETFRMIQEPRLAQSLSLWCGGILLLIILGTFLPWTQNIRSHGKLTTLNPADRPQTVHSTIAGRIEKWHVQEGQSVKKGDTIITLSEVKDKFFDPEFLVRIDEQIDAKEGTLKSTRQKAEALQKQIAALQSGLKFSLDKARNKVKQTALKVQSDSIDFVAAKTDFDIAKVQLERQEKLYKQGLKSLTEYETRRLKFQEVTAKLLSSENKYYTTKNELVNSRIELNSLEAEYLDKISKAESDLSSTLGYLYDTEGEISKMNNEYANMQIRSSFYGITAPQDGYVVKALVSGIGETVKEGQAVASVMPADPELAVELYVKPVDIPLLTKGRKVRLQFDGWPALVFSGWPNTSFGTFGGKVAVIDNIDSQGKYRILVVPDPEEDPWPKPVRVGSGVYGWAMLNDVPIWYEIWRQLNGFPADYMADVAVDASTSKEGSASKTENNDSY